MKRRKVFLKMTQRVLLPFFIVDALAFVLVLREGKQSGRTASNFFRALSFGPIVPDRSQQKLDGGIFSKENLLQ